MAPSLDPRANSLNQLRLGLAALVLVSHSYTLSGHGAGPILGEFTLGTWAVFGFFCLSGYLITASRYKSSFGTYVAHRVARIFPAFLVCLVVVAFGFAPIVFWHEHGSLAGFLSTPSTPLNYVLTNSQLKMFEYTVAGTLSGNPYPNAWDGPLWSLYYEFFCYVVVGVLGSFAVVRRTPAVVAALFVVSVLAWVHLETTSRYFGGNADVLPICQLLPFFLAGSLVWMLRERVPPVWYVALPAAAVSVLLVREWPHWGGQAAAPLIVVVLVWLGRVVPEIHWTRRNDISYGVYIYAFPNQQLVAHFAGPGLSTLQLGLMAVPGTLALALLSWFLVERPVLRAVRGSGSKVGESASEAPSRATPDPVRV